MSAPSVPGDHYRTIGHWRGFAALWVLLFHGFNDWLLNLPGVFPGWLASFVAAGWLGVHVFFVISGYCIAERAAREYRAQGSVLRFLGDRFLRIYPPFWAALALALVLNVAGAMFKHETLAGSGLLPQNWEWLTAGFAVAHWLGQPSFLLVAWTLAYELGFYLVAAIGLSLALRTRQPWLGFAWGGFLALGGLLTGVGATFPLLAFWPHFALGALVWLLLHRTSSRPGRIAAGSAVMVLVWTGARLLGTAVGPHLLVACLCAWLLLVLHPWDRQLAGWAGLRWLGSVGTFSYSLYLVHAPLVGRTRNLLDRTTLGWPAKLGLQVACCLAAVAAAWLFYRLIELRSESARRALITGLGRTNA